MVTMVTFRPLLHQDSFIEDTDYATVSTIEVMRKQEDLSYHCRDYLCQEQVIERAVGPQVDDEGWDAPVDEECRMKMAVWFYHVVDFCRFSRETVAIAMSYLDRFLTTEAGRNALVQRRAYQLAAMTALYTAVKVHEPQAMDPKIVSALSRGEYTEDQVTDMELSMIEALDWHLNPPTALSFVRLFLSLIPREHLIDDVRKVTFEIARFQTELALQEYDFVMVNPSTIAYISVANALRANCKFSEVMRNDYLSYIADVVWIDTNALAVKEAQERLCHICTSSIVATDYNSSTLSPRTTVLPKTIEYRGPAHGSPRFVGEH